ncbi:MAG: GAK system CofD-like protein [Desulfovibrio sp.]|nr:GAK system CofD-like protein [Desulfovibrio sp.]
MGIPQNAKPRLLFFTGGTALRSLARYLAATNPNTIHIVTTFDSGGSTAELRRCFAIPAMGDLRNRLLALSDTSLLSPQIPLFLEKRLPQAGDNEMLFASLLALTRPENPFWQGCMAEDACFLQSALAWILRTLPSDFDLHGASIGNLILTSVYLQHGRDFEPSLSFLRRFLHVQGLVVPVVDESLHLGCELDDGTLILGQHLFKTLPRPIRSIFLSVHDPRGEKATLDVCRPRLSLAAERSIQHCDLICYPMGSFYSSVLVNLLVRGVPQSIAKRHCPKIFIPNLGHDPELGEVSILRQVAILLDIMHRDAPFCDTPALLNGVLIDSQNGQYRVPIDPHSRETLQHMGITLFDAPLTKDGLHHDPALTSHALEMCL